MIVTEGKTEAQYFEHFRSTTGPRIESVDKQDSKISLVKKAVELREQLIKEKRYIDGDITWVVFDHDEDGKKPNDKETFNQALKLADESNIEVACSNDSFELWFLLHFQAVSTAIHRDDIERKLKEHLDSYKHGEDIFDKINANYNEAVKRARQMLNSLWLLCTAIARANKRAGAHCRTLTIVTSALSMLAKVLQQSHNVFL